MSDKYIGLDYGLGKANIDIPTGIRYGVISINSLHDWIWEQLESEYGDPTCPKCDSNVTDSPHGKDYFCEHCSGTTEALAEDIDARDDLEKFTYWSDQVFGDEPLGFTLNNSKYEAHSAFDNTCLFLTKSPYYTKAVFCSPCAPGAGDLNSTTDDGVKTFCFGHNMFEGNKAPYQVYKVSDDSIVEPEKE
jgi:hypothetical protein